METNTTTPITSTKTPQNREPQISKKQQEKLRKEAQRKAELKSLFDLLDSIDLLNTPMCAIDFEAILTINKERAYPCEIGLVEFTISEGEMQYYHSLLDPRPLPQGHQSTINYTKLIHGIDSSWYEPQHGKHGTIWKSLCDFVGQKILLARGITMEVGCLNWLASKTGKTNSFQIIEVEDVLEYIHHKYAGDSGHAAPKFKDFIPETGECHAGKCRSHKSFPDSLHCALGDARLVAESLRLLCARYLLIPEFVSLLDKEHDNEPEIIDGWTNNTDEWQSNTFDDVTEPEPEHWGEQNNNPTDQNFSTFLWDYHSNRYVKYDPEDPFYDPPTNPSNIPNDTYYNSRRKK